MKYYPIIVSVIFGLLAYSTNPAYAESEPSQETAEPEKKDFSKFRVAFDGIEDKKLKRELQRSVPLAANKDEEGTLSERLLKRRAEKQIPTVIKLLRSHGYYDASARVEIDASKRKPKVIYIIEPGVQYTISIKEFADAPSETKLPDLESFTPLTGEAADADIILASANKIKDAIGKDNCVVSVEVKPKLTLDTEAHTALVRYHVEVGAVANFGSVAISGNEKVKEDYIRKQLKWKEGECLHTSAIDSARTTLIQSQLFSSVNIKHGDTPDDKGEVPVTVEVKERFQRTIKAGLSYMTDQGPGASLGWENRNYFGEAETLSAKAVVSELEYSLSGDFTKPYYLRPDQSLKLSTKLSEEQPDAYTSRNFSVTGGIERQLRDHLKAGAGLGYRLSHVEDVRETNNYGLAFVPLFAEWDSRNDVLNPSKGISARLDSAPYFDTLGSNANFVRNLATARTYFRLGEEDDFVLGLRGALGSITATSTRAVPADLRFYAGGGSSVRGYGYQKLSPYRDGELYGGRSLLEFSSEVRIKFTDTIGGVVFLDGGNAFDNPYPDFQNPIKFGTGIGGRYYTDFGPLRVDVGFPLNKDRGDSSYQLYVSLGQAF